MILINPAGLTAGPTGVVNVNSFIGTTLDITDEDYLAGSALNLSGNTEADVVNLGTIRALTGDVHLVAKHVVNTGTIEAPMALRR